MARAKKKKSDKPLYDEEGKWVDQDSRVLSGIRRAYRLSPQMQETLQAARIELPPKILKSGKPGKRNQIKYKCAECGELFATKNVQVDHIEPATPLNTSVKDMTWDAVVKGIFCGVDNLQVVCSTPMSKNGGLPSCHAKKSREENFLRKKLYGIDSNADNYEALVERSKGEYLQYRIELAEKLEAKEERKRVREEKKNKKLLAEIKKLKDKK